MKQGPDYLMESEEEAFRLDVKTDIEAVRRQAIWCGVKSGLRILDLGCGAGKTTYILNAMVSPEGSVVGVDLSADRIEYAKKNYGDIPGIDFIRRDITKPIEGLGQFDIIWVRFILEYFRKESPDIVRQLRTILKPGGTLCLIDLDYNCLGHYEMSASMSATIAKIMNYADEELNFDTYAGRKLYSYMYDQHFDNIELELMAHHLIYGEARREDAFNWFKKLEIGTSRMQNLFLDYPGGSEAFTKDFKNFFLDPRRFTYTPLILCKGMRPYDETTF